MVLALATLVILVSSILFALYKMEIIGQIHHEPSKEDLSKLKEETEVWQATNVRERLAKGYKVDPLDLRWLDEYEYKQGKNK